MLYKAIPVTHRASRPQTASSVEIFEVQRTTPPSTIQPSEDFRRALEQSPADVREAFRELITHDE